MDDTKSAQLRILERVRKNLKDFQDVLNENRITEPALRVDSEYLERALGLDVLQQEIENG